MHFEGFMIESVSSADSRTPVAGGYEAPEKALFHEMMLTRLSRKMMLTRQRSCLIQTNKSVYICFLVALAMLAASPTRAADQDTGGKLSVVRVDRRTGKLVRTVAGFEEQPAIKPAARPAHTPAHIGELVEQSARAHSIDPLLVDSVIKVESNYNPYAVSVKGAEGLMQLMPSTSRMLGVSNSFDPGQNIEAGVKYLKYLQDLYKDDRLALAAYNAGPAAVDKYKWVPPYPETQNYVNQVGKRYQEARKTAAEKVQTEPAATLPVADMQTGPAEDKHPKLEQFVDQDGRLHLKTAQEPAAR
jgi:Transglycosylase SLT domain